MDPASLHHYKAVFVFGFPLSKKRKASAPTAERFTESTLGYRSGCIKAHSTSIPKTKATDHWKNLNLAMPSSRTSSYIESVAAVAAASSTTTPTMVQTVTSPTPSRLGSHIYEGDPDDDESSWAAPVVARPKLLGGGHGRQPVQNILFAVMLRVFAAPVLMLTTVIAMLRNVGKGLYRDAVVMPYELARSGSLVGLVLQLSLQIWLGTVFALSYGIVGTAIVPLMCLGGFPWESILAVLAKHRMERPVAPPPHGYSVKLESHDAPPTHTRIHVHIHVHTRPSHNGGCGGLHSESTASCPRY